MPVMKTDLGDLKENAKRLRFEQVGAITATNVQDAIAQVATTPQGITPTPVGGSPYNVVASDTVLYVDTSAGAITINLQPQAARLGVPLVIKDVTGNGATNPISLVPSGAETVDGLAPYPIAMDFGGVKIAPETSGYTVTP